MRLPDARANAQPSIAIQVEQASNHGPHEELEADERRDRVAGQAEDELVVLRAEPGRLAGPQRDAPEALLDAQLGERRLDVVVRADRDAAGDDDHIGGVEALREGGPGAGGVAWRSPG